MVNVPYHSSTIYTTIPLINKGLIAIVLEIIHLKTVKWQKTKYGVFFQAEKS